MTLYIRKVLASKWLPKSPLAEGDDPLSMETDGITNCCKTSKNTISIWKVDSRELQSDNDKKVILTLSTNGGSLAPIDCVFIESDEIESLGLSVVKSEGDSLLDEIKNELHYDICNLNMSSLIKFGRFINVKVRGEKKASGDNIQAQTKKLGLNLIKECIAEYIPEHSDKGKELLLKKGFSKTYS